MTEDELVRNRALKTANGAWETSERLVCLYTFWSSHEISTYVLDKI